MLRPWARAAGLCGSRRGLARRWMHTQGHGEAVAVTDLLRVYRHVQERSKRSGAEESAAPEALVPSSREIFANSEVHLDKIKVIGFDYDFTLASYRTSLQRLIYSHALEHLVERKRYPEALRNVVYDKSFAVRGLTFDKERGLLFKLGPNFKLDPTAVFRGRQRLDPDEALEAFAGVSHVRNAAASDSLVGIFDQFSLAEGCLLADVCDHLFRSDISFSPAAVWQDVSSSIAHVHISGIMHSRVMASPETYLHPSPKLRKLLEAMRHSGKETFLLSNSSFDYVDSGMRFLCGEDWMTLFGAVLTDSQKPSFFSSRDPFRQIDLSDQGAGPRRTKWSQVTSIKPMHAYAKGNITDLMNFTGWRGSEVLYIGDHVFADLRNPARFHGWWTGAIIRELEREISVQQTAAYRDLAFHMQLCEETLRRVQWAPPSELGSLSVPALLDELEADRKQLRQRMNDLINRNFGSVFVSSAHSPSLFASYMERYVDLYTSRLENFLEYSLSYRFYPRRRKLLAHDALVPSVAAFLEDSLKRPVEPSDIRVRRELSMASASEDEDEDEVEGEVEGDNSQGGGKGGRDLASQP